MKPRDLLSPLYCRYNGFMLGVFYTMSLLPFARPKFPRFRRRMLEFLGEVGVAAEIPKDHTSFSDAGGEALFGVLTAMHGRSETLGSSAALGGSAILHVLGAADVTLDDVHDLLDRAGIPRSAFARFAAEVPARPERTSQVLSPALELLRASLARLRAEPRTCFVAMPFRRPFEGYYPRFYRPALETYGRRAIRAWGGVGMEDYLSLVLTLIEKSGSVMADVSDLNPNVVYEVGVAQGMGKTVYLLTQNPAWKLPANLAQHQLFRFRYSTRARGWEQEAIPRFSGEMAFQEFAVIASREGGDPTEPLEAEGTADRAS